MANRLLTINIRDFLIRTPVRKRHMRLSNYIKLRIAKSTNVKAENIKISQDLNSLVMTKYLKSMHKLKVNINIEKEKATVTAFSEKAPAKPSTDSKTASSTAATIPTPKPVTGKAPTATQQSEIKVPKKDAVKKADSKEVKS
jgi:hypothetical protein